MSVPVSSRKELQGIWKFRTVGGCILRAQAYLEFESHGLPARIASQCVQVVGHFRFERRSRSVSIQVVPNGFAVAIHLPFSRRGLWEFHSTGHDVFQDQLVNALPILAREEFVIELDAVLVGKA